MTPRLKVVLDANVLYPPTLRDTLLRAAEKGFLQAYWSERILDEVTRNIVGSGTMTEERASRLRATMTRAFPEASITGYEHLISAMKNDKKDRHVVAAAVKARAQVVVTANLKDFRDLPEGIEAESPDDLLCKLFEVDPVAMVDLVKAQAADHRNPPHSLEELLKALAKVVPRFAANLRAQSSAE